MSAQVRSEDLFQKIAAFEGARDSSVPRTRLEEVRSRLGKPGAAGRVGELVLATMRR